MSGRRIDLSATQVVASMLAAVTGAVAASTLGIAGTVIGAAVMSVASTAVAAVYKHYIGRSRERLRAAAEAAKIPPLVGGSAGSALRRLQRASPIAQQNGRAAATVPDGRHVARADADQTEVFPAVGFGQHRWHDADRANGFARHPYSPADDATEIIGGAAAGRAAEAGRGGAAQIGGGGTTQAGGGSAAAAGRGSAAEPDGGSTAEAGGGSTAAAGRGNAAEAGGGSAGQADTARTAEAGGGGTAEVGGGSLGDTVTSGDLPGGRAGRLAGEPDGDDAAAGAPAPEDAGRSRWRRPLVLAGAALGVFLLAMGGITAFEAVAGKPLDAIVGGKHTSGTTIGSLIGGQSAHTASHHATNPTPTPGSSTTPTPTTAPSPTAMPTPTTAPTPTPTPTRSAGASPAPSAGASAGRAATQ
jgi:hypothetical protein